MQNIITGSVQKIEQIQKDTRILHIHSNNIIPDPFKAGDKIVINSGIPLDKNRVAMSTYTLLTFDRQTSVFQIAVKQLDDELCGIYLNQLPVHETIEFRGPKRGFSVSESPDQAECFFIATDTAISDVIGFLNHHKDEFSPQRTRIFCFVEDSDDFFHHEDSTLARKKKSALRTGFTTGACSAAAAKGAARMIITRKPITEIESTLPNKDKVIFQLHRREFLDDQTALCSVIKDAGDDPDCTDGAELTVMVTLKTEMGINLRGGDGVATVTKEGLGLSVGAPAINPVPSKNIREMVLEEIEHSHYKGAEITISVPEGEEMAKKTINARLGLIGGISILGTRGTVKPFSTSAYRASVIQAVNIARASGCFQVIATTGWRTEKAAMAIFPNTQVEAFIQAGDFIGTTLRAIKKSGIKRAVILGMIGKLSKMADGVTMTHQAGSMVNMKFLAALAAEVGAGEEIIKEIGSANTARHVMEICQKHDFSALPKLICQKVVQSMDNYLDGGLEIHCYMVDFEGALLAKRI